MALSTVMTPIGPVTFSHGDSEVEEWQESKNVTVMLDTSGSMSGSRVAKAIQVVKKLWTKTVIHHIVNFESRADIRPYSWLDRVRVGDLGGGTCFQEAFNVATALFQRGLNIIVLVTDAETTQMDVDYSIHILKTILQEGVNVQVHSIGIHADPQLLLKLAQVDVAGTVLNVTDGFGDEQITEFTDAVGALIDSACVFKLVPTPQDAVPEIHMNDLDVDMQVLLFNGMLQEACKDGNSERIAERANELEAMLGEMKIPEDDRRSLKMKVHGLWDLARRYLDPVTLSEEFAKLLYAPQENYRLSVRLNKGVVKNAKKAVELMKKNEVLEPYEFEGVWLKSEYQCILSTSTPQDAYEENDLFCLGLWTVRKQVGVVVPEMLNVQVQPVYLTWNWFKKAVPFAMNHQLLEEGVDVPVRVSVIENLDSVRVNCVMPLIPNESGYRQLCLCAALWSAGDIRALSMNATRAFPILVLMNIYIRERSEWLENVRALVEPMCKFVLDKDESFVPKALRFGEPDCRLDEVFPSLSVFLMRCIVAGVPVNENLSEKIFIEFSRRLMSKEHNWTVRNLWESRIKRVKIGRNDPNSIQAALEQVRKNWMRGVTVHNVKLPSTNQEELQLETLPKAGFINQKLKEITECWWNSPIHKILVRHSEENGVVTPDPTAMFTEMSLKKKLEFLARSKLNADEIRNNSAPDTTTYHDADLIRRIKEENVHKGPWFHFAEATSVDEAAMIWALVNTQEAGRIRKKLTRRENWNIPLYKIKLGIITSDWRHVLRIEEPGTGVVFLHVLSKPSGPESRGNNSKVLKKRKLHPYPY